MISVIMPAYNSSQYIGEAIESILHQTYRSFELIVVVDGSKDATDTTLDIARLYERPDLRVRVIEGSHGGPSRALNTGIELAKNSWIAVMHADDIALPQRLEKQINAVQTNPRIVG